MSRETAPEPIRVGLLANWCDSRQLCELYNRMTTDGNYEWVFRDLNGATRRLRITWDDEPDFWAVCNAPPPERADTLDRSRTVVFQMEPLMAGEAMRDRWGEWAAPSPLSFLQVRDHRRYRNSCDWWVGLTHAELVRSELPGKSRSMAACVSRKYNDPGHRKRVDFLHFLDAQDLDLDVYGHPEHGFHRYRGPTPQWDKSTCLLPYRYYFDAENNAIPNFFTEKIVDCLLAETLCFYWGCPNLDSYFDPRAFIQLELDDFDADLARIREAIATDEWTRRLPYIRAEKRRILEDYGFFATLARAIDPVRRARRWNIDTTDRALVDEWIGDRRCGGFVELTDRRGPPEISETLDAERRLDWSGICLESSPERVAAGRSTRDAIVTRDDGRPVHEVLEHNGIPANAIDWLNLAVEIPSELLAEGGRIDPSRVRANLITIPSAPQAEQNRCAERLGAFGYTAVAGRGGGKTFVRAGADEVFGCFHLCTIGGWREVMAEQMEALVSSRLAARTARIFASVSGPESASGCDALTQTLGERVRIVVEDPDPSAAERPILEYMRRFCEEAEPLSRAVWYAHSKGVSPHHRDNPNVVQWRRLMEHFVFGRWEECLGSLRSHDVCGVNWHAEPAPHFSGNFWWATPRYLRSLPETIGPLSFDQEAWIGSNQPRARCLHESGVDHYLHPYPAERYRRD